MANKFQIKRTAASGVTPNTTNVSNSAYIAPGELAVNMADKKLFTANTSGGLLELGSNLTNLSVTSTATLNSISANGSLGSAGQVLTSNGSSLYWAEGATGGFTNGQSISVSNLNIDGALQANNSNGSFGQVLTSDGSGVYWSDPAGAPGSVQFETYTYTINANTTTITGLDDSSRTLIYTANLESVYVNGAKIIGGVDYFTTNATAITLAANVVSGDVVQVVATRSVTNIIGQETAANTTSTSNTVVDTFDKTIYRTAKYLIQIKANSQFHATEVLIMHDDTNAYLTEYATIFSNNDLGNVYANVNGANVELVVSPLYANSTINTVRITLGV